MHNSVIQISKSALKNNIDFIKSLIDKSVTLSSVIKGNAYGHSILEMVPLLQELHVNHFSVYSSFEAKQVFKAAKNDFTILIMGDISVCDEDWIIENSIEFFVFNISRLERMLSKATKIKKILNIHIEIETGMNRTGFNQKDWIQIIQLVNAHKDFIKLIKPYKNELLNLKSFKELLKIADSTTGLSLSYDLFSDKIPFESYSFHVITLKTTKSEIPSQLEESIIKSVENNIYFKKAMSASFITNH
mgnify:CR=1 FL=1